MKPTISIGVQNFKTIRENNAFYVDKTFFIKEWWEAQDPVTLITRPRRFGKTLNMSMVEHFFPGSMMVWGAVRRPFHLENRDIPPASRHLSRYFPQLCQYKRLNLPGC